MSPKVSRKNGNFNTKCRTRNIIHKRFKAVLNSRVWSRHLECHPRYRPPFPAVYPSDTGEWNQFCFNALEKEAVNGSVTHFQALFSLSGNTGAENHREWEEEIGSHISNSDLRARRNLEERLLQLQ